MNSSKKIIEKGRIGLRNLNSITSLVTHILMVGICLCALYSLNFPKETTPTDQPVDFFNVVFVLLTLVCIYLLFVFRQKLKIKFYTDSRPMENKIKAIERVAQVNKWKFKKAEWDYCLFWEYNLIWQSYYVTIVVDENGFYINSFPSLHRILDFGASQKNSDEIYEQLRDHLDKV